MNFREELENYFKNKTNRRYSLPIMQNLVAQYKMDTPIGKLRNNPDKLMQICDLLVKDCLKQERYTASVVPTIISPQMGRNFYLENEKKPTEEELFEFLYLIMTGIYKGSYIINIANARPELMNDFRDYLINREKVIFTGNKDKTDKTVGIRLTEFQQLFINQRLYPPITEFTFTFLVIAYFLWWVKERSLSKNDNYLAKMGWEGLLDKFDIRDDTVLIIYGLGGRKKKVMYSISRLKSLISRWYKDYLENKEKYPSIVNTVFSFYIWDKNYRDLSIDLLDKFIYYFLDGYINGEVLDKLMTLKLQYELNKDKNKVYGISAARDFFKKL
jgi:hypothetical protein